MSQVSTKIPTTARVEVIHNGKPHFCYPSEVCLAVLEYYAFDARSNCQPQARANFRILAGSKLREMIYSNLGCDPTKSNKFDKWHDRIALNYQSAPKGFFHVFNEANTVIYELIMAGADISEKFVGDISIGQHWSKHWDTTGLEMAFGMRAKYPHKYPDSHPQAKSNPQESWCYPLSALGPYREWLQSTYLEGGKFAKISEWQGQERRATAIDYAACTDGPDADPDRTLTITGKKTPLPDSGGERTGA